MQAGLDSSTPALNCFQRARGKQLLLVFQCADVSMIRVLEARELYAQCSIIELSLGKRGLMVTNSFVEFVCVNRPTQNLTET